LFKFSKKISFFSTKYGKFFEIFQKKSFGEVAFGFFSIANWQKISQRKNIGSQRPIMLKCIIINGLSKVNLPRIIGNLLAQVA
jgi:hypothetical protein